MESIKKYPRTPHLVGSRLQPGDEDLSQIPFAEIKGRHLVVEEKCDGANTAISFSPEGELLLQSRGHYLTGGYRERHYNLMKQWANVHKDAFYEVLGSRYIMYGEWMYAKHTVFMINYPTISWNLTYSTGKPKSFWIPTPEDDFWRPCRWYPCRCWEKGSTKAGKICWRCWENPITSVTNTWNALPV